MKRVFKYIEQLWIGADGKMSLRASLAIAFSIHIIRTISHAVWRWEAGRSLEGLSLIIGIEAGLIAALLSLTTYQNIQANIQAGTTKTSVEVTKTEQNPKEEEEQVEQLPEEKG